MRPSKETDGNLVKTTLDGARAAIGHAMRAGDHDAGLAITMGDISLLPHQLEAVVRLQSAITHFGGALLADDVGLGKTFVALAVAREYQRAYVLAPASLVAMWQSAVARADRHDVTVRSLHSFSATPTVNDRAVDDDKSVRELVVIDEAHYLRNRNTARYSAVSRFVSGRDVLLLSATPLHNASSDVRNLLALFAGTRADLLEPALLAQIVVRREDASSLTDHRPSIIEHEPLPVPLDSETLSALLALPAPLPAHDGAIAGALIRLGLLRAWCSSDAALAAALERRLLRGSALQQALESGRHPTSAELRSWLVGDHEVQLAFPELMASQHVASGPLLGVLSQHLRAISELLAHHRRMARGDAARTGALRGVLKAHPGVPVLAFSQFAGTVRALYRALGDIAGVGSLSSERGHIASGPVTRSEVLARFAPVAQGVPPPPRHQALRMLLATDVLAEGVNLQDAGVIVHLDVPWTDALVRQRVGRVVRIGSAHRDVHVYAFGVPDAVEGAIRLLERVHVKAEHAFRLIGGERKPRSSAMLASHVHARLHAWHALQRSHAYAQTAAHTGAHTAAQGTGHDPWLALAVSEHAASSWLALVQIGGEWRLLASSTPHTSSGLAHHDASTGAIGDIVTDDVGAIAHAMEAIDASASEPSTGATSTPSASPEPSAGHVAARASDVLGAIRDWLSARLLRSDVGAEPTSVSAAHRRVERQVHSLIASAPSVHRARFVRLADDVTGMLARSRGIGAEQTLEAWYATRSALEPAEWLADWTRYAALASQRSDLHRRVPAALPETSSIDLPDEARVEVLILLVAPFCDR